VASVIRKGKGARNRGQKPKTGGKERIGSPDALDLRLHQSPSTAQPTQILVRPVLALVAASHTARVERAHALCYPLPHKG